MEIISPDPVQGFIQLLDAAQSDQPWSKLLLGKHCGTELNLKRITVRPIILRNAPAWSFVYSYKTRDITKNLTPQAGLVLVQKLLDGEFRNAHLFCGSEEVQLEISKKGKATLHTSKTHAMTPVSSGHDRAKNRFVDVSRPYLTALGITDQNARVIPAMAGKWKQINKFIEVFSQALNSACLLYTSPSPRDGLLSRMPSSA